MPDIHAAIEGLKRGETWRRRSGGCPGLPTAGMNSGFMFTMRDFTATDWERVQEVQA